jgi:PLP dependent protein
VFRTVAHRGRSDAALAWTDGDSYYAFPVNDIEAALGAVRARIEEAARQAGRAPSSIRLIAVSKTKPAEDIRLAYEAGQRDFGENYVQELVAKAEALADLADLRFHFIGHLQRNKAKQVVRLASSVHSVDSVRLATELGKQRAALQATDGVLSSPSRSKLPALVEVNVGGEAQKSGCSPEELASVLDAIDGESALELAGLMTVPPATAEPSGARRFFDALAELRERHGGSSRLPELSMGMTHDLEHAIAAGATIVRVGTAIFGRR